MLRIFDFLKRKIEWVLILTLVVTTISPLIFTQSWTAIDFTETGQIGDTIGGLTAPFLNFLSIILLYLTLREQTQSSKKQNDFDSVSRLYNVVKNDFENIELHQTNNTSHKGTKAIFEMRGILLTTPDISVIVDEALLRAFSLSFSFLMGNLMRLLKRNYESTTDKDDKLEIYDTLRNLKSPLDMIVQSAGIYFNKRAQINNGQSITKMDKLIGSLNLIKKPLDEEFEKYKIS